MGAARVRTSSSSSTLRASRSCINSSGFSVDGMPAPMLSPHRGCLSMVTRSKLFDSTASSASSSAPPRAGTSPESTSPIRIASPQVTIIA